MLAVLPTLQNCIGQLEVEARSRRANLLDALVVLALLLGVLWIWGFGFGVLGGMSAGRRSSEGLLLSLLLWMLFGSAWWHRDSAASRGLGSPHALWLQVREREGAARWRLLAAVLAIFGGLLWLSLTHWPEVARFFRLPDVCRAWPQSPVGWAGAAIFCVAVASVVATCAIRYDNAAASFAVAGMVIAGFLLYAVAAAWLHRGGAAFEEIDPGRYLLDVTAYSFWGFLQQAIFTSYFATRLRKGIRPAGGSASAGAKATHGLLWRSCLGGITGAMILGPIVWGALWLDRGPLPALLFLAIVCFAFAAGAVWTCFYVRAPRRMWVASLSGLIFGLIHIDSYGLVLVTTALGIAFAYAAMDDRFRNLAALAVAHGVLGSTFGKLFKKAGELSVDYHVGPWHAEQLPSVLIVPLLCIAVCLTAIVVVIVRKPRIVDAPVTNSPLWLKATGR